MSSVHATTIARAAGLLLGMGLATLAVLSWRVPAQGTPPGTDLALVAARSGALELSPSGRFLNARSLSPGAPAATGQVRMRNQTGGTLVIRPLAKPSTQELDRLVEVELSAGAQRLYSGPLGGMRGGSRRLLRLGGGASATLAARAWIPSNAGSGWQGRAIDVQLELLTRGGRERGR